jgi:uncharacterized protein
MILNVTIENYQSIRDRIVIDLTVGKHAPGTSSFAATPEEDVRVTLTQALMGANGSGKSTILKAIATIRWIIVESFREDTELPLTAFAGDGGDSKPTVISVTFDLDGVIHTYEITSTSNLVLREKLSIKSVTNKRLTSKQVFERTWDEKTNDYTITDNSFRFLGEYWKNAELKNSSLVPAAQRFGNEYANRIVDYWRKISTNIEVEEHFRPQQIEAYLAARYYGSHPESRKNVENDIRRYDLGIEGFGDDGKIKHKYKDSSFELSADQESSGTMQILLLHRKIERILDMGGVAIIDEFDAFLHPLMTKEMIGKFTNPKTNPGKAQLLFSSHDPSVLDYLTKYEVYTVDKSEDGVSSVKRVDSMPGIRTTQDLKKMYLEGRLGGVPDIEPR